MAGDLRVHPHNLWKNFTFPVKESRLGTQRSGAAQIHNITRHLPGRKSSERRTIVNVTQSKSCRLAVICGPLLPMPIHSVRMEFLHCFSSTLRLRKIRQKFVFLPKRCHSKGGPVFRAALGGGVCSRDGAQRCCLTNETLIIH